MKYEDFKKYLQVGDFVQVIAKDLPLVMGKVMAMDESLLYLCSLQEKIYVEMYGDPFYDEIFIEPTEIKYIFKIIKPKPINVQTIVKSLPGTSDIEV